MLDGYRTPQARSARLVIMATWLAGALACSRQATADDVDFSRDILPILSDKCFACHGPDADTREADLRLDEERSVFQQRDEPTIVRGQPENSLLVKRILSTGDDQMPPKTVKKQLTDNEKQLLQQWIRQGAEWAQHWAYVLPQKFDPPEVPAGSRVVNEIDRFIQARLHEKELKPSAEADEITLVRRLHFDLLGLPPKPEDVDAYLASSDPQKFEKLVDRLLDSKHFGERLAIYWLDVVRYADSNGYHSDEPRQVAPYRDYVIESFNKNKPYDQFVIEQLAGDLLPAPTMEQQVGSGFNMLLQTTSEGGAQAKEYLAKYLADRVRNTSQIFLGSTMGCCECHSHKYDPFTLRDFYSFGAFFADLQERAVGNPATYPVIDDQSQAKLNQIDSRLGELRQTAATGTGELTAAQLAWEADVAAKLDTAAEFGPWQMIGPFKAASFEEAHDKAFGPESGVDLRRRIAGQSWKPAEHFVDGQIHSLSGDNSATYLFRTVKVATETTIKLSLGSDDSIIVWLNGEKIHENRVQRGVAPNQDSVDASLQAGENQLLLKVANGAGGYGFYFSADSIGIPPEIVTILRVPRADRNTEQTGKLATHYRSIAPLLQPVRDEIAQLEQQRQQTMDALPRTLMTKTATPREIRVLPRGNWLDDSGDVVQPAIPEFLGSIGTTGRRANRLDLATWIVQRDNPLTARTFVNRLWKLYFGQGLATPLDDLGRQGTLPTHPKLLDWLACEFMDSGWNIKHTVRLLVTSATYRQTSTATEVLQQLDPYNRLYARQSRFRLDAELVRDNALAISGLLVDTVGGRSVYPYQPAGYWRHMNFPVRKWPGDKGDALYRRGLYTWWQRMFLHPSMSAFDAPSREECTVERPRSNIPQQALVLLNDPTYVEAARAFAVNILREGGSTPESRIEWAFRSALSRTPLPEEAAVIRNVLQKHLNEYRNAETEAARLRQVGDAPAPQELNAAEHAAWTSVARIILNLHETITRS
jgi:mono/diheme cytochrome c family protein